MNELLVQVSDNLSVHKNDLVRYYTIDRSKIQYGLAKSYDKYENLLTVSAQFTSEISPSNIIMSYPEEEWHHITIEQSKTDETALVNIYPFQGEFHYTNKPYIYTSVKDRIPYVKQLNLSFDELMTYGPELFLDNVKDVLNNVVNNEIVNDARNLITYRGSNVITDENTYNIEMGNMDYTMLESIFNRLPYKFSTTMNYDKFVLLDVELFLRNIEYQAKEAVSYYILNNYKGSIKDVVKVDLPYSFKTKVKTDIPKMEDGTFVKEARTAINWHLARYVMKNTVIDRTKVPLPYTFNMTRNFTEMHDDPVGFAERCRDAIYEVLDNTVIQEVDDSLDELFLPYKEYFTVPFNLAMESGAKYCEAEVVANARTMIDQLVPKYTCDNGIIIVKDLPYIIHDRLTAMDILNMDQTAIEDYVVDKVFKYIDDQVFNYEYGVMVSNEKMTMSSYLSSAPVEGISQYKMKESIINRFEQLLGCINAQFWEIKTVQDSLKLPIERTADLPLINEMEFVKEYSSSMKHVYKMYINHAGEIYRAFLIINNRRLHKNITIASPHITSQNSIVLKEVDDVENPLTYEMNYLKFLINDKKNEVKQLLECDKDYH